MALASPAYLGGTHWFLFAATVSFISTIVWSFVYLLGIREALNLPIDWWLSVSKNNGMFVMGNTIEFDEKYHSKVTITIFKLWRETPDCY